ncbi:MAG: cellulase family glycosylhydrolase [Candidatus Solibacter sp.]|nr:cellulase family glycosylhydrolase [Candidatus Solibacter sp.]
MSLSRRAFVLAGPLAAVPLRAADTFVRVSRRDPRYLELSDGSPYIPIGLNLIAPPGRDTATGLRVYQGWLDKLAANGGNYVRAWLSNAFWDVEHARSGEYDEQKAQLIDAMLAMARQRGIRVKLTLEHFRSIGGGPQAWADKPLHSVANGGPAASIADFFDGEKSRAQFRRKLEWFAARFGNRPEVFAWELWNEVNAVRGGGYLDWTEAMLAELHRRFPRNLCLQSLGSFDTDRVRPTYQRHSTMPGNDLAQVHRYLDLGAALDVCHGPVDVLAADAVRELLAWHPGKPVILAESGAVEPRHAGPFKLYSADKQGTLLHDILFAPFFAGAAGPGQIWHWDAYVAPNDLWWHFGRFADAVKGIDPPSENFIPSILPHPRLRVYQLRGKRTTLIWCRDTGNDWRSELERGEPPGLLTGVSVEVGKLRGRLRVYDPWPGKWSEARQSNGRVNLPDFRRSLIVRAG